MNFLAKKIVTSFVLVLILFFGLKGQSDSVEIAHTKVVKTDTSIMTRKPGLAFWYGLAIPGGGQIFNKRWWKLPLVYGAYGGAFYYIKYTRANYSEWNGYYQEALRTNGSVLVRPDISFNAKQIKVYRDRFRDQKDVAIFFTVGVHLLASLEAFVDAHLKNFSMDEDLSFKVFPQSRSFGLAYSLH